MKTFEVFASETVFYRIRVEAKNAEDAREEIFSGNVQVGEAEDSEGFEIEKIVEITPEGFAV